MAQEKVSIVAGWSARMDFTLKENGTAKDLTGFTLSAEAMDRSRNSVTLTGNLAALDATAGTVRLIPDTGDFPASGSPYLLRFKTTDASEIAYFPSEAAVLVEVYPWL